MKYLCGIVFAVFLAISASWAQQVSSSDGPASKQDIERLFVALHVRERQQLIMDNSRKQAKTMLNEILEKELPEASKEEFSQMRKMIDEMIDDIEKDYPMDAILKDLVPIYQKHLTQSDANRLLLITSRPENSP
jgi:hypothetical protein